MDPAPGAPVLPAAAHRARMGGAVPPHLAVLAAPLYCVAALLVLFPLIEVGAQLGWTASPRTLNWRTGAVGLLSSALVTPTFGICLALVTAHLFGHRGAQLLLAWSAGLGALALLLVGAGFGLDSVQLRGSVTDDLRATYTAAVLKAMADLVLTAATLAVLAFASRRARRAESGRTRGAA